MPTPRRAVIDTVSGTIEGTEGPDGIRRWFGVPYAAPPVGERRWRPPAPIAPWTGIRPTTAFGPDCPQSPPGPTRAPGHDEDCLQLNVWAPADAAPAPVMVWFYGGSFLFGSGSDPVCDGTALARAGVVLVTVTYRVGLFGFLAHPELTAESPDRSSGNYGLLDMVAALRWVRDNIVGFGGDPGNVTAFGVSAGSASLSLLATSPLARGCFDRLILQSPGSFRPLATLAEAESAAEEAFGPAADQPIRDLREQSADAVLALTGRLAPKVRRLMAPRVLRPIADGWVVPGDERRAYATGALHPVPVLVGGNLDEGSRLTAAWPVDTVAAWHELLALEFGAAAGEAAQLWPAATDAEVPAQVAELFGDTQFRLGARGIARAVAASGSPAWRYLFTRRRSGTLDGPHHGDEVPYVFGVFNGFNRFNRFNTLADPDPTSLDRPDHLATPAEEADEVAPAEGPGGAARAEGPGGAARAEGPGGADRIARAEGPDRVAPAEGPEGANRVAPDDPVEPADPADVALSEAMGRAWIRFATHGDPNGDGLPVWPPVGPDGEPYLVFDTTIRTGTGHRRAQLDFLDRLADPDQMARSRVL